MINLEKVINEGGSNYYSGNTVHLTPEDFTENSLNFLSIARKIDRCIEKNDDVTVLSGIRRVTFQTYSLKNAFFERLYNLHPERLSY